MRISDWSSDVCSSDLCQIGSRRNIAALQRFAGECGYGNRHILKPFLTTAGRYDDLAAVDGHFLFGRGWRRRSVLSHHWHSCQQGNACEKSCFSITQHSNFLSHATNIAAQLYPSTDEHTSEPQ